MRGPLAVVDWYAESPYMQNLLAVMDSYAESPEKYKVYMRSPPTKFQFQLSTVWIIFNLYSY